MDTRPVVDIFTDGACSGNPGPGGWGVVLRADHGGGPLCKELSGGDASITTNNRMELTAAIMALRELKRPCVVGLYTDSRYVMDGATKSLDRWKTNRWQTTNKSPVKNIDLWQELDAALQRHEVTWHWVKGHAGHPENERADRLAVAGMETALAAAG